MRATGRTIRMLLKAALELSEYPETSIYIVSFRRDYSLQCCAEIYHMLRDWKEARHKCIPVSIHELDRLYGIPGNRIFLDHTVFEVDLSYRESENLHRLCERMSL